MGLFSTIAGAAASLIPGIGPIAGPVVGAIAGKLEGGGESRSSSGGTSSSSSGGPGAGAFDSKNYALDKLPSATVQESDLPSGSSGSVKQAGGTTETARYGTVSKETLFWKNVYDEAIARSKIKDV